MLDRESVSLFNLIERADIASKARWAFFEVLARLTFDGHISRDETTAFLVRIEQNDLIDDTDMAWWGEQVVKLGFVELDGALRRVWSKPICEHHNAAHHAEELDTLKLAAADRSDACPFDEEHMRAPRIAPPLIIWPPLTIARGLTATVARQVGIG